MLMNTLIEWSHYTVTVTELATSYVIVSIYIVQDDISDPDCRSSVRVSTRMKSMSVMLQTLNVTAALILMVCIRQAGRNIFCG